MTPDPALDRLARFTPNAGSLDPAEVLFRAGRASARTPRGWKLAAAGLLLANLALLGERLLGGAKPDPGPPAPAPVVRVPPAAAPAPDPGPSSDPAEPLPPWSVGALLRATDPAELPPPTALVGLSPADPPLTPRSRGEID